MTRVPYTWQDRVLLALIALAFVYEVVGIIAG
jgi:hypothetical protein